MYEWEDIAYELSKMQPFIFMIENEAYYIGRCAFRKCTENERKHFEEFNNLLDDIQTNALPNEYGKKEKLASLFQAIHKDGMKVADETTWHIAKELLCSRLKKCSDNDLRQLVIQKKRMVDASKIHTEIEGHQFMMNKIKK